MAIASAVTLEVHACLAAERIARLRPHPGLDRFRPPQRQLAALVDIATDPRGCVTCAVQPAPGDALTDRGRLQDGMATSGLGDGAAPDAASPALDQDTLVGYAAFHPPSEVESWGDDRSGRLIELGAVEVAPDVRGQRLAERLLAASFSGGRFDGTVVFATLYVWHYDLARTGMTDLAYRRMLERMYRGAGLELFPTSDVEIRASVANALMARIGPSAPAEVVDEFHRLRKRDSFTAVASGLGADGGGW